MYKAHKNASQEDPVFFRTCTAGRFRRRRRDLTAAESILIHTGEHERVPAGPAEAGERRANLTERQLLSRGAWWCLEGFGAVLSESIDDWEGRLLRHGSGRAGSTNK
jgi:hypothetical protein